MASERLGWAGLVPRLAAQAQRHAGHASLAQTAARLSFKFVRPAMLHHCPLFANHLVK